MFNDDWITAAMTDDTVVVELLVRLKRIHPATPSNPSSLSPPLIPLRWGIRLPRTRHTTAGKRKSDGDSSIGFSPTTPLSWSGGGDGSSSPVGDCFEESSRDVAGCHSGVRSKGQSTTAKKLRKKKMFTELKEEESSLLNERIHLKKELAILRETFTEQRSRNEKLKKMKVALNFGSSNSCLPSQITQETTVGRLCQREMSTVGFLPLLVPETKDSSRQQLNSRVKLVDTNDDNFSILPDLNMMPSEEDVWHL